jgi:hypothetical protein
MQAHLVNRKEPLLNSLCVSARAELRIRMIRPSTNLKNGTSERSIDTLRALP